MDLGFSAAPWEPLISTVRPSHSDRAFLWYPPLLGQLSTEDWKMSEWLYLWEFSAGCRGGCHDQAWELRRYLMTLEAAAARHSRLPRSLNPLLTPYLVSPVQVHFSRKKTAKDRRYEKAATRRNSVFHAGYGFSSGVCRGLHTHGRKKTAEAVRKKMMTLSCKTGGRKNMELISSPPGRKRRWRLFAACAARAGTPPGRPGYLPPRAGNPCPARTQ